MKSAKIATIVSTLAVIVLMVNHTLATRLIRDAIGQDNVGVELPRRVVLLIKLDHFFMDYFYGLIPILWLATVLFTVAIRAWLDVPRAKSMGEQP